MPLDPNASTKIKSLPLPDVGDFLFLFVIQILLFAVPNLMYSDGSTGWHLVAGEFILKTGQIPHTDLFSNTFPEKAWVAYEWLFDLLIAICVKIGGLKFLAVVMASTIGFLFLSIYDRTRREGSNIIVASFLVVVAILTSATHWLARPHIVGWWCLWIFVTSLENYYRNQISLRRLAITLALTMLLWVNCHPAFMLGMFIVAIYSASSFMVMMTSNVETIRSEMKHKFVCLSVLFCVLGVVTLINPYGFELHQYILGYLRESEILSATNEFLSPVFKGGLHPTCLEILFVAFAAGLFMSKRSLTLPSFLTCLTFGHMALSAVRSMPLYAIVATPFIGRLWAKQDARSAPGTAGVPPASDEAPPASSESVETGTAPGGNNFFRLIAKSLSDFNEQENHCKMHLIPIVSTIAFLIIAATGGSLQGKEFIKSTFDPACMPIATLEYVKKNGLDPKRGFNFDNWGGYLCYNLGQRVFIDDRADFYGPSFYTEYSVVMAVGTGWQSVLDKYKIDWILFPKNSALTNMLKTDSNWKLVSSDEGSELFVRNSVKQ